MQGFKFRRTPPQEVAWCGPKCKGFEGINWKTFKKFSPLKCEKRESNVREVSFLLQLVTKRTWNLTWYFQRSDYSAVKHCQENVPKSWVTDCSCIWLEGACELFIRYCRSKAAQMKVETWGRVQVTEGKLGRHYSSVQRPNGR